MSLNQLYATIVLLFFVKATFSYNGQECTTRLCTDTRGHISYISGRSDSKIYSIITPENQFTTIVLFLDEIYMSHASSSTWLRIYVQQRKMVKKYEIKAVDAKILSFNDANEVIVEVLKNDYVRFRINYYVGCYIHEGKDVLIERERSNFLKLFSQRKTSPNCWFIFPVTREQKMFQALRKYYRHRGFPSLVLNRDVSVKETHLSFSDVQLTNGTTVSVYNMMTGKEMMYVDKREDYLLSNAIADSTEANYSDKYRLKQVFLVDLKCQNKLGCGLAQFKFRSYGMKQSDLNCVEKEMKCKYNIGEKDYSCSPKYQNPLTAFQELSSRELTTTSCSAFNYMSEHIIEEYGPDLTPIQRSKRKKNKKRKGCKNIKGYCRKPCNFFAKRNCARICLYFKKVMKICRNKRLPYL